MPFVGFEPRIPGFEREKIVYALDGEASMIGVVLTTLEQKVN
jgi:hypothetical protein